MPARIISWWLTTSASAGASLSVEMKNCGGFHGRGAQPRAAALRRGPRCGKREGSRCRTGPVQ
ncbi:MAG: hypothetical protein MZW92_59920 [Comamonadaceae bacterium]|nr:hypothetical protein [Comamonadaceae bacterium]